MIQHASYLLLDAARMAGRITEAQLRNASHDSLYRGTPDEHLAAVAPYLFRYAPDEAFSHWYLRQGWGASWGVLLSSSRSLDDLARHLRSFLTVRTETGQLLHFRFYDPRVLRVFLPTCDAAQLRELFAAVDSFLVEDDDPSFVLRFWQENGILRTQRFGVADVISGAPEVAPLPHPTAEDMEAAVAAVAGRLSAEERAVSKAPPAAFPEGKSPVPAPADAMPSGPQPGFRPDRAAPAASGSQNKKWNLFD